MPTRQLLLTLSVIATSSAAAVSGCSSTSPQGPQSARSGESEGAGMCEAGGASLRPIAAPSNGSTVALGKFGEGALAGKALAFVADEDARSITVIDVDKRQELSTTKLIGTPSQLTLLDDGRLIVALKDKGQIQVLHPRADGSFETGCRVETAAEPIAVATTPDKKTLLVTSGWGHSLESFDLASIKKQHRVELPREPRSVVVDDAGKFAYVAHAVGGRISTVDLAAMKSKTLRVLSNPQEVDGNAELPQFSLASAVSGALEGKNNDREIPGRFGNRIGCQGFPITKSVVPRGRILAPQVLVDPGDPENRAQGYGDANNPTEVANVAVIDAGTQRIVSASLNTSMGRDRFMGGDPSDPQVGECILPRAAAVDDASQTLLVTCLGIDAVVAYDLASTNPAAVEKARFNVGSGPTGIAVDPSSKRAVVWSQFERTVDVIDLRGAESDGLTPAAKPDRIALKATETALPLSYVLGRQLFHTVGDARISKDGRACASCHPDGRDDAITWATPEGPRRTMMLAGRVKGSEPLAWGGTSKDIRDHLHHTFERLNGQGLRNVELEALVTFVEQMPAPPTKANADQAVVARGQAIFNSKEAQCATCHTEGMTDGKTHDVKSKARADRNAVFDTPTLRFVSQRAPYFHDGRYDSLRDLLQKSDGDMGHTKHLSPDDLAALEAFLHTL
jgi:DNA-binding beta-propeller fold protein YncE/mono/diheme cytochrome c family protein